MVGHGPWCTKTQSRICSDYFRFYGACCHQTIIVGPCLCRAVCRPSFPFRFFGHMLPAPVLLGGVASTRQEAVKTVQEPPSQASNHGDDESRQHEMDQISWRLRCAQASLPAVAMFLATCVCSWMEVFGFAWQVAFRRSKFLHSYLGPCWEQYSSWNGSYLEHCSHSTCSSCITFLDALLVWRIILHLCAYVEVSGYVFRSDLLAISHPRSLQEDLARLEFASKRHLLATCPLA